VDKYTGDGFDEKASKQSAKRHMIGFKAEIVEKIESKELPHVNFRTSVVEGIPEECILQCASDNDVSLIVMGTRGVNKKEHDLLGSVTAEVLDACKFPVFTVPENISLENLESIQHIAFFSNLIQQDVISFDIFTRFFDNRQLEVTIISVLDNKDDARADDSMKQLIQYCEDHYAGYKFRDAAFSQSSFLDEFQQYVVDNHIDLIVVPNKKKNIFARLFNPSLAHRVLFQSDTPMLVVPV
jgi:nucleotide-binding universal stress UspA family protein